MTDLAPETDQAKIVRVVDIETSGLPDDEQHAICEIGWVDLHLDTLAIKDAKTFLVNPGHPIPPHIRAVHHISDADVAGAMFPDQALLQLMKGMGPGDVFAAHKADFEQAFIGGGGRRWICTLKCAHRAWPDFVSHGNQALRYQLDIDAEGDFPREQAMPPHRALPDAWTTAFILRRLLQLRPLGRLVEISGEPLLTAKVGFGKYKGKKWTELPVDYLDWIVNKSDLDADTKAQARYWLERRQ